MLYLGFMVISLLLGLILLATGVVLLLKVQNKIIGGVVLGVGVLFTLFPLFMLLFQVITSSVRG